MLIKLRECTGWSAHLLFAYGKNRFSHDVAHISLYPRHLCRGLYSFLFPSYVHSFICSFVHDSVPFVELLQSFTFKFLKWGISHQPLIRNHSYLDHRYPGGSAFIPWLLTLGSMPQGGARGQNLGHLKKFFFYFSVMETTYADSWSDMIQPCDMDLWVMKVSMTYISRSSDFALYIEDYLMYEHHTLGLWVSMTRHLTSK